MGRIQNKLRGSALAPSTENLPVVTAGETLAMGSVAATIWNMTATACLILLL